MSDLVLRLADEMLFFLFNVLYREDRVEQPSWFGVSWYLLLLAAGVVIVVIKGIIIPCFSFMLTLMNNVEKDAATRTNTGKTEKETRPNQPARDQPAREPSPPTSMSTTITS